MASHKLRDDATPFRRKNKTIKNHLPKAFHAFLYIHISDHFLLSKNPVQSSIHLPPKILTLLGSSNIFLFFHMSQIKGFTGFFLSQKGYFFLS